MISELIEAFKKEGSNLSSRSGGILKAAIAMLQEIAPKETELQETELQETELTELY